MTQGPGLILHTQRLSTDDGPGIRTSVFFKGCPLRCDWCHNPESISRQPQVHWLEYRCIGCNTCLDACPADCLSRTADGIQIDQAHCDGCGLCAEACPAGAMELLGRRMGVDELLGEVVRDRVYYETSGGGVTATGGEPLMQPEFLAAILRRAGEAGIQTAVDTCGFTSQESLEKVLPHTDILLFDLKEFDPRKHAEFTGADNGRILDNLLFVRDFITRRAPDLTLWVRTPLIPDRTATMENITQLGNFLAHNLSGVVSRWELCAFNNLCQDKYRRLGQAWHFEDTPLMTASELAEFEEYAKTSGVEASIVIATGPTAVEMPSAT